jgi:carboxyl-terminal processing protease
MNTFTRYFSLTVLVVLCLAVGFSSGYLVFQLIGSPAFRLPILVEAYQILLDNGLGPMPTAPALEYGMIRGMVQAYGDPYTIFVEPPQHELETNTLQGSFGGIGVRFERDKDGNLVLYPFPDSPAKEAGIQDGDRLLMVGDLEIASDTPIDAIQAAVRGSVGEQVQLTIARAPDFKPIQVSVKRKEIPLPSLTWHLDASERRLGVIQVNVISSSTPDEIVNAVEDLKSRGATAYALDLRNNGGGLLDAGVQTARLFLKDGTILQEQYRGKSIETYKVEKPGALAEIPLVVLVNNNTASAAEIIAGALKANQRARLIGTPTFGKDTVQLVFDLKDGSSLHVTAAHWWIPGLEPPLKGHGLQPDVPVEQSSDPNSPDEAILAAIRVFFGTG